MFPFSTLGDGSRDRKTKRGRSESGHSQGPQCPIDSERSVKPSLAARTESQDATTHRHRLGHQPAEHLKHERPRPRTRPVSDPASSRRLSPLCSCGNRTSGPRTRTQGLPPAAGTLQSARAGNTAVGNTAITRLCLRVSRVSRPGFKGPSEGPSLSLNTPRARRARWSIIIISRHLGSDDVMGWEGRLGDYLPTSR